MLKHDKCEAFEQEINALKQKLLKYEIFLSNLLIRNDDLSENSVNFYMTFEMEEEITKFLEKMRDSESISHSN